MEISAGLDFRIGSLRLGICRLEDEWQVSHERSAFDDEEEFLWERRTGGPECVEFGSRERFFLAGCDGEVSLMPALPDRPVVTRPVSTFVLQPRSSIRAFVSAPVWLQVVCESSAAVLTELPIVRPSDTWFGRNTVDGQLCYGGNTTMRHKASAIPRRLHRAVVPVEIDNQASTSLRLERVLLPMPLLSLYSSEQGGALWTQSVSLVREEDGAMGRMGLDNDVPPPEAGPARRVAVPREAGERDGLQRALSVLFG